MVIKPSPSLKGKFENSTHSPESYSGRVQFELKKILTLLNLVNFIKFNSNSFSSINEYFFKNKQYYFNKKNLIQMI